MSTVTFSWTTDADFKKTKTHFLKNTKIVVRCYGGTNGMALMTSPSGNKAKDYALLAKAEKWVNEAFKK